MSYVSEYFYIFIMVNGELKLSEDYNQQGYSSRYDAIKAIVDDSQNHYKEYFILPSISIRG